MKHTYRLLWERVDTAAPAHHHTGTPAHQHHTSTPPPHQHHYTSTTTPAPHQHTSTTPAPHQHTSITPAHHHTRLLILNNTPKCNCFLTDCDYKVSALILSQNYYSSSDWTQNTLGHILKSYKWPLITVISISNMAYQKTL